MNRLLSVWAVVVALVAAAESRAQFFDDFDGNALAPHWQILDDFPGAWDYGVSGGLLTVNSLNSPASMGSPTNYQRIDANFPPVAGDWIARVTMGWEPGSMREMRIRLSTTQAIFAEYAFSDVGAVPRIIMSASSPPVFAAAPASGMHEFEVHRTGAQMHFYFDGAIQLSLPAPAPHLPLSQIRIGFDVAYPEGLPMSPLYVDRVSIVPAPSTGAVALFFGFGQMRRRR